MTPPAHPPTGPDSGPTLSGPRPPVSEGTPGDARPHGVILGGGFGGLAVARGLRDSGWRLTVIDRTNHHLFQPLLYQVAMGGLSAGSISMPLRGIFRDRPDVTVLQDTVLGIDVAAREVLLAQQPPMRFDACVVATGVEPTWFGGGEAWARVAPPLKRLQDAHEIHERFFGALEQAEIAATPAERAAWLTFVVVGAGPTGVETAGAMAELARGRVRQEFRHQQDTPCRVILVEAGPAVLPGFPAHLQQRAAADLTELGVEVRLGHPVRHMTPEVVTVGHDLIPTHTVVWAAGLAAPTWTRDVVPLMAGHQRHVGPGGRLLVNGQLKPDPDAPIWVIGDLAACPVDATGAILPLPSSLDAAATGRRPLSAPPAASAPGTPAVPVVPAPLSSAGAAAGRMAGFVPWVAPAAQQMGAHVAAQWAAQTTARPAPGPFRYHDRGQLATIGRRKAVGLVGGRSLTGFAAWSVWVGVHLLQLLGPWHRIAVLFSWIRGYLSWRPGTQIVERSAPGRLGVRPTGEVPEAGGGPGGTPRLRLR